MTSRNETWLQPHEGVRGHDLSKGHLLALDDDSVARRLEVLDRTWRRWGDILHARIDGRDALFERMYNPRVGDLVVEQTTSFRMSAVPPQVQAFGLLLVHERKEWASSDEQWARTVAEEKTAHEESGYSFDAEEFARSRFADTATYIQYGPSSNDVCRWVNCKFIAVPVDLTERFI